MKPTVVRRLALSLSVPVLGAFGAAVGLSTPAQASALDATCTGTEAVSYTPGVTFAEREQEITTSIRYIACVSASDPDITSATIDNTVTTEVSCLDLFGSTSDEQTIVWNDGSTSRFSYNTTITNVGGQTVITRTGNITDGRFDEDAAVMVNAGPQLGLLDCLGSGIESRFGSSTLEITSVK